MNIEFGNDYISVRNLANAINVVREGRVIIQRDGGQFLDTDAQLVAIIFGQLMNMQKSETVDATAEALPLAATPKPEISPNLARIHELLSANQTPLVTVTA